MAEHRLRNILAALAVFCFIIQGAYSASTISYDDFLQCLSRAVAAELSNDLDASALPDEVLHYLKEELYENQVLKNFASVDKDELTKMLANDLKTRRNLYEKNKKTFKAFTLKVMEKDMKNYPAEDSGIDVMTINFLSLLSMETLDGVMNETIDNKKSLADVHWDVLTLKDVFRTIFYYCKYPKEVAPFLTENMRTKVKEWLDDTATWGLWGFDSGEAASGEQPTVKLEL